MHENSGFAETFYMSTVPSIRLNQAVTNVFTYAQCWKSLIPDRKFDHVLQHLSKRGPQATCWDCCLRILQA